MSMSPKDKVLLTITGFVLLFGITGANFRNSMESIKSKKQARKNLQEAIFMQKELIANKDNWANRYNDIKNQMPVFNTTVQVDTYWLNIMDLAAERYGIKIRNRKVLSESLVSDVYEFPIEVKDWEGTLESFIKFMYAMQNEGAMLDIRELNISPIANKQGMLKGSFTLYCAYMRDDSVDNQPSQSSSENQ